MTSMRTTTIPSWPGIARRVPDSARVVAFALFALAVELVLARGVAAPGVSRFVLLFVVIMGFAFVLRFPMATALVFLGLTDFIFHPTFFALSVGSVSVRPHELALLALLLVALFRPARQTWGGVAGGALAVFLAMVTASAALAFSDGRAPASEILDWGRSLGLLTFFYVVVRLFPSPQQRRLLLTGAAAVAAATGVIALAVAFGAGFGDALQGSGENTIRSQEGFGSIDRVRLPGLSAGYALFWYVVVQIAATRGSRRWGWTLLLAGIAIDIVVSFNRNMWLGIAIGLILMAIVGGTLVRSRLLAAVAVAIAGAALIVGFDNSTTNSQLVEPVVQRGSTIFNPSEVSEENSFKDRRLETELAWGKAKEYLLTGVGVGAPFNVFTVDQIAPHSFLRTPRLFIHNQYLYLLLICGIPGLIAFLVFLGTPLTKAFRRLPRDPAIAACGVGLATIMISSLVAIYFTVEDMTAVLGLLTGVIVADAEDGATVDPGAGPE